jgi:hypothetical protein
MHHLVARYVNEINKTIHLLSVLHQLYFYITSLSNVIREHSINNIHVFYFKGIE